MVVAADTRSVLSRPRRHHHTIRSDQNPNPLEIARAWGRVAAVVPEAHAASETFATKDGYVRHHRRSAGCALASFMPPFAFSACSCGAIFRRTIHRLQHGAETRNASGSGHRGTRCASASVVHQQCLFDVRAPLRRSDTNAAPGWSVFPTWLFDQTIRRSTCARHD